MGRKRIAALTLLFLFYSLSQTALATTATYSKNGDAFSSASGQYATSGHCSDSACGWITGNEVIVGVYSSYSSSWTGGSASWNFSVTQPLDQIQSAQLKIGWPSYYGKGLHSVGQNTTSTVQVNGTTVASPSTSTTYSCGTGDMYAYPCFDFIQTYPVPVSAISGNTTATVSVPGSTLWDIGTVTLVIEYGSVTPVCSKNSDCGTDGWTGSASCSNNDVYQTYRTFTCNNPGTISSSCSFTDTSTLKQDCGDTSFEPWSANYCNSAGNVEKSRIVYNKGCSAGACTASDTTEKQTVQTCTAGCTAGTCNATTPSKPQSTGNVKVSGRKLLVNGVEFKVKSIGYAPTPIGSNPEWGYDITVHPELRARDFPLLRAMGANAIRTWGKVNSIGFLDDAWNSGNQPIRVIMGYWMGSERDYQNAAVRQAILADFNAYVRAFKSHPAILMWAIGNEENWFYGAGNNTKHAAYFSLVNEMAKNAYQIEGSAYHPVAALALEMPGSIATVGNTGGGSDDASIAFVDIWGINHYPGNSFGNFFNNYAAKSSKPLLITEYGIDALDNRTRAEYEATQAEWNTALWREIAASTVAIGGSLMAYSDEWWKDFAGNVATHDFGGYPTSSHPDGYSNEEWWGIVRVQDNGSSPDIVTPRQVYYSLQAEFGGTAPACSSNSDCGTDSWTGSPFCQSGNVYQNYITYTCNNPGTASASCSNSTTAKLKQTCTSGCSNGTCIGGPQPGQPVLQCPAEEIDQTYAFGWTGNNFAGTKFTLQLGRNKGFTKGTYTKISAKASPTMVYKKFKTLLKYKEGYGTETFFARLYAKNKLKREAYSNVCEFEI